MKYNLLCLVRRVNITRKRCNHLVGKEHSSFHRIAVGVVFMTLGVGIAKSFAHNQYEVVEYLADITGYGLHGLGLTPIVERLLEISEEVV